MPSGPRVPWTCRFSSRGGVWGILHPGIMKGTREGQCRAGGGHLSTRRPVCRGPAALTRQDQLKRSLPAPGAPSTAWPNGALGVPRPRSCAHRAVVPEAGTVCACRKHRQEPAVRQFQPASCLDGPWPRRGHASSTDALGPQWLGPQPPHP